ncbi:MAG: STAS domain-containing protein [Gemmatimonadetes bacterium]|nr:STAS domain-containing protein [Gemmatimonadota bacterium]
MAIQIDWSRNNGVLIARPQGRIFSSNSMDWQSALERGSEPEDKAMVVDFAQVPYLSSAGLRVLLTLAKQFTGAGHAFGICQLTRKVRKVVDASGFDRVVSVYESEAEAVAAITGADGDGS